MSALRRGGSLLTGIWRWLIEAKYRIKLFVIMRFLYSQVETMMASLELRRMFLDPYPCQLRLRDRAMRRHMALVHVWTDVLVDRAVVIQQHGPRIYRLLLFLQLWSQVLRAHLVVDAILAQVAVNSCVVEKANVNDGIRDGERRNQSRYEGKRKRRFGRLRVL